ncbi:sulfite exporter TauE/SafE family protein [Ochrobactrum quorumnocens]|uniref:Probable membrane transporter protein n=1 Tax=Ochrobactrum quorumnocens TaxID=271865 RepID=A0A248UBW0_9HYPH|nr:sulfite exporter TauE/SafE family protein [[Ochrobactrum] quorumnocens]ASV84082.1 sulfite exporter TauE/SafE family protein [[Ochrobactrum] quorumnocens]
MEQNAATIVIIVLTFLAAGAVKGVAGMGLPTVAMGVLGALVSPLTAAALLLVPSFVTNVWQLLTGPSFGALVVRLWPMMAAIVVGTLAGAAFLTSGNTDRGTTALGLALIVYAAYTLFARPFRISPRWERWSSPIVGLTTGFVTGGTGVFVIPAVPYIQSLGLERDDLVQALGLSFTVSTLALAAGLLWHGAVPAGELLASTLLIIPALTGMAAGQALRSWISPAAFRCVFLICLFLLGAEMASRSLW